MLEGVKGEKRMKREKKRKKERKERKNQQGEELRHNLIIGGKIYIVLYIYCISVPRQYSRISKSLITVPTWVKKKMEKGGGYFFLGKVYPYT